MPLALTFLFPVILYGCAAAAAPIIIHLIMRTKPRRVVFPALRFVKKTHHANISKLKLKHLILLAMRVLAILLIAVLIARASIPNYQQEPVAKAPAAAVLVFDNSGSMNYRDASQTRLAVAKAQAITLIRDLPEGSRVAVLATDEPTSSVTTFLGDRRLCSQQVQDVPAGAGDQTVAAALKRAADLVKKESLPRKEVYLFTDMTAQAWRDLGGELRQPAVGGAQGGDVRFIVVNCGQEKSPNLALGDVTVPNSAVAVNSQAIVESFVQSSQMGGEFSVQAELDGKPVEQIPISLKPNEIAPIKLMLTPQREGVVHGLLRIQQGDKLDIDNTRYFTLRVGAPAQVLVVRDAASIGTGDLTAFLMSSALAPEGTAAAQARTVTNEQLDREDLRKVDAVVLANVGSLPAGTWKKLDEYVTGGGHVWVVPGGMLSASAYNDALAQKILPASLSGLQKLPRKSGFDVQKLDDPLVSPFAGTENPPLRDVLCEQRLGITAVAANAHVALRFKDKSPAIVTRKVGDGWTLLWTFSPEASFSNLAQLRQFVVLAQRALRLMGSSQDVQRQYVVGQTAVVNLPQGMTAPSAVLTKPGLDRGLPLLPDLRSRSVAIPVDVPGNWTVQFSEDPRKAQAGFSVNVSPAESDLSPVKADTLPPRFPAGRLAIANGVDELSKAQVTVAKSLDLAGPLLLALLALLIGESFFSNRFYKQPGDKAIVD